MDQDNTKGFSISLTPYNERMIQIPLYKDTYQLLQLSISTFIQSNKLIQGTLCKRAIDIEVDIISLIIESYKNSEHRTKYLNQILNKHIRLYTLIKLIIDNSKICQQNASRFIVLLEQIGKQTNGWLKE